MPRHCPRLLLALMLMPSRIAAADADADGARPKDFAHNALHKLLYLQPDSLLASPDEDDEHEPQTYRQLGVKVAECMDTSNWFPTRNTGGIDLFRTYYDCDCTGDLSRHYTFRCRLNDYCYVDEWNDNTTNVCIDKNLTFDFSVDSDSDPGVINIEKGYHCVDYLKGTGPRERVCFVDTNVCTLKMKDDHSFTTEASVAICSNNVNFPYDGVVGCAEILIEKLGYTEERARELCPSVTMGGTECQEYGNYDCRERTGETRDEMVLYKATHDCSNVEPCAKSSCQAMKVVQPGPGKVHLYPECSGLNLESTFLSIGPSGIPTAAPSANGGMPTLTTSPSSTDNMARTEEVDDFVSGSIIHRGNKSSLFVVTIVAVGLLTVATG